MFPKSKCLLTLPSLPILRQPTGSMKYSITEVAEVVAVRGNIVGVAAETVDSGETVGRAEVVAVEVTVEIEAEETVSAVDVVVVDSAAIVAVAMERNRQVTVDPAFSMSTTTIFAIAPIAFTRMTLCQALQFFHPGCTANETFLLSEHSEG